MAYVLRVDIDTIFERKMATISECDTNMYKIGQPLNFSNFKRDFAAKLCNFTNFNLYGDGFIRKNLKISKSQFQMRAISIYVSRQLSTKHYRQKNDRIFIY